MFCFCFCCKESRISFSSMKSPKGLFKEGEKLSSSRAKMPKEKKVKGRKWPWPSASWRSGKPKGSESSLRKGLRTSALDRTSSSKETSLALSDGPLLRLHHKEPSSISTSKYLLPLITQALDPQSATQLFKLAHEDRPETKQKKQRRLATGTSQPRDHLPFEQDSHHLGEDQEGAPVGACLGHRPH